ncbi:MAG: class I SAM-dependent methyltransferase [Hyphomicrobiales bacterium]|nr:class I SAM-dependent methyltransferase [Hyphomicrobiales bacterium]
MRSKYQIYERIAQFYDFVDLPSEYLRYRQIRPQLFVGLEGRILDAGVGTGRNIPFYPRQNQVVGIDLSPAMLARARVRKVRIGSGVDLREMDVCKTDFPDGFFDAVVSTFLFCVLDDSLQLPALRELARISRRGGLIRLLEYSLPANPVHRFVMKRVWTPWVRWLYGAAFDRNTEQYLGAAGLQLIERRFVYGDIIKLITVTHT